MIDTSADSIRVFAIMILAVVWFYLLNQHIRDSQKK